MTSTTVSSGAVGNTGHVRFNATTPCMVAQNASAQTAASVDAGRRPVALSSSSAEIIRCSDAVPASASAGSEGPAAGCPSTPVAKATATAVSGDTTSSASPSDL